jgi:uncharacterized protein involved in exopolysaccharide biosynthesis/Mrp family chromosome partitioning ATPase
MQSQHGSTTAQDIDVAALGHALWRAKKWVVGLAIAAGLITFVGLSMVRPLYTSEARILIENDISPFTRAASDQGRDQEQVLDEQAVESQVQVLTSRDLALDVTKSLDLANNPEFAKDAGVSLFKRLLNSIGLGRGSAESEQEKAADAFVEHLAVYALNKSSVIAVDYTSGDTGLAAEAPNKLADAYIDWQRSAKIEQTKDATAWLSAQIEELRKKVAEAESAVEQYRSSNGLYEGSNNVTLNAQQLSELNSQLILAKAQKSEAEARARGIKKMLDSNGDIDATPEVLKSDLIGRLIEQRVQVQRQLAELSATLLPSHPRIKQLNSELADVRTQIRDEATKIVKGLENESEVASARESSLRSSLNDAKSQSSGQGDAEIKLRALEREAKANRDLLESYLARYRDASSRHDMGAVPANATIVSRAHASTTPSFPKRGQVTVLVMAAAALLSLAYVLASELIGGTAGGVVASPARRRALQSRKAPDVEPVPARASTEPRVTAEPEPQRRTPNQSEAASAVASEGHGPGAHRPRAKEDRGGRAAPVEQRPQESNRSTLPERSVSSGPASESFINRLRRTHLEAPSEAREPDAPSPRPSATGDADGPRAAPPNDLRRYLQQRAAIPAPAPEKAAQRRGAQVPSKREIGSAPPPLTSLDAVLSQVIRLHDENPRGIVLVAATSPRTDAAAEAIEIARMLASTKQRVLLADLTRGASSISGPLGLPRAPGFTDLVAGRAGFEDIVRVDGKTPLQVIAAGNPNAKPDGNEAEQCVRIFEALAQAYDCIVLHADPETIAKLEASLQGRLSVMVAVLAAGTSAKGETAALSEFAPLGCPILFYEKASAAARSSLFGRVAAV